ncbi:MAG: T9SS type A sorting domain-containing protein [Chitinophagaceae bacterium]|nr:T9SS type A sorting domain-containing protein [Chitinophagaceae bacterium]
MRRAIESSDEALAKDPFSFEVFPNPATDQLTIRLQSAEKTAGDIRIYDGMGKLVSTLPTEQLNEDQAKDIKMDTQGLSGGTYYIVIQTGEKKYVKSIVITR